VKDEGLNPTASFKARGLSCAVSMCVELGIKKVAIPSAGNAASAMAAYAAAAGIEAHIFMPRDVPQSNYLECKAYGAHVTLVDGLISDCGRMVAEQGPKEGWFDVSTLKEPYRIEGKKTMGYEVAEQMGWELPDAIFYPTGGGVGMIGMWKALRRWKSWAGSASAAQMPRSGGRLPAWVVRTWRNEPRCRLPMAHTGQRSSRPKPLGDSGAGAVREGGGTAIAVLQDMLRVQTWRATKASLRRRRARPVWMRRPACCDPVF
jgi:threonine synthase